MKVLVLSMLLILAMPCYPQDAEWEVALNMVGGGDEHGTGIALDSEGNVYVSGYYFSSALSVQGYTLFNSGSADIFFVKFNSQGELQWAKTFGSYGIDYSDGLCTDSENNIYISGYYDSSELSIDDTIIGNQGDFDIFIAKYNGSGELQWVKAFGGEGEDIPRDFSVDPEGNIVFTGQFDSPEIHFDDFTLHCPNFLDEVLVAKISPAGDILWAKRAKGDNADRGHRISTDNQGNVIVVGGFGSSSLTFGPYTIYNTGSWDVFTVKLNSQGEVLWLNGSEGYGADYGFGVDVDEDGSIYTSGYFNSEEITFGGQTISNHGWDFDIYVTKYGSEGGVEWAKGFGGDSDDRNYTLFVSDMEEAFYISGFFSESMEVDEYLLTSEGVWDGLLIKADYDGNVLYASQFGGSLDDLGKTVEIDPAGNLYVEGNFKSNSINFGDFYLINEDPGQYDFFLAKGIIYGLPQARFNYETDDLTVTFQNISSYAGSYSWSYGDGVYSDQENPIHIYAEYGEYEVTLIAFNENGSDTASATIILCPETEASFEIQKVSTFTIQTKNYSLYADSYLLELGNGDFSYDPDVTYTYYEEGDYQVILTAYNECSQDTAVRWVHICKLPASGFNYEIDGLVVYFYNTSMDADSCMWLFGDGLFSHNWDPVHIYQSGGNYDVTMITWNDCGSDTLVQYIISVSVTEPPADDLCRIFPNPASQWIQIILGENLQPPIQCDLYHMNGGHVFQKTIHPQTPQRTIHVEGLDPGCYLLTIRSQDQIGKRKIIIF